jgi:hypothetical protein
MRTRKIRDEADAKACLAAVRAAGGDRLAWAHAHRVDARSLNMWRVVLERRASSRQRTAAAPKMIELVPSSAPRAAARYVLDVGSARVEFDDSCSAETLQRVVRALRAC